MKWLVVLVNLVILPLLLLLHPVSGLNGADYIQVHSVFPPILQNYWENGMRFWAFGLNTVVTDNYIRLTESAPDAKGYLWNRHSNHMESFELNVTLQMRKRGSGFVGSTSDGGMGIWYTSAETFTGDSDTVFFGFKRRFFGVGVVLDHSDVISLVTNDGSFDLDANSMRVRRNGYCRVPALGELHITITIRYEGGIANVLYVYHDNVEPRPEDYARCVFCTTASAPTLSGVYRFGVTAANSALTQATHEIHSVIMTPLSDVSHHLEEENKAAQVRLFAADEKAAQQELLGSVGLNGEKG
ncbi:legume-like lectin [Trypanosoma grayi]|uniref:legume-like lectin n=1 Tax=Trypanosoma grayi TaxID=71804 RepID=UPI0004F443CC|nr:legume-like lectin [Trypanosoma grayi]KEG12677.1 legume-like lectin [Trypanosoma grayi]